MSRTTLGYLLMTACSAAVLWAILRMGSNLHATQDWSGTWTVVDPAIPRRTAEIQQSGIYFHIRFDQDPARAYKLERRPLYNVLHGDGQSYSATHEKTDAGRSLLLIDQTDGTKLKLWRDAAQETHGAR